MREETRTASPGDAGVTPNHPVGEEPRERHPFVFVLDRHGTPLQPCTAARARKLLKKGRAVVHRHTPFVIRLKDRTAAQSGTDGVEIGVDPGSKHTGIAAFTARAGERRARYSVQLDHRGATIRKKLEQRAAYRRGRRTRNLRYRAPRFLNRARSEGWLPPSLRHRVDTTVSWATRLARWAPVRAVHVERVAFDTHALAADRPLEGAEYQRGTLHGYEVREYLLAKWNRTCAYCGATGVPLNIDHIHPRSRGGSDRVSNLALACLPCNETKSNRPVEEFLANKPKLLARIKAQAKAPLRDAAAVQSTRPALWRALDARWPTHTASGGRTKWNRTRCHLAKTHTLDALAVGKLDTITEVVTTVLLAGCTGRGTHTRTRTDKHGFPRLRMPRRKQFFGFTTGDLVRAHVPTGKKAGTHTGRVAVRASGSFNITTRHGTVQGIRHKHVRLLQRADGYAYTTAPEHSTAMPRPSEPEDRGMRLPRLKPGVSDARSA
ncbi:MULTISPECIES: RNA-guided endonuclease IscB [Streptomyces]|uniref:RNA-guided endonuclease IscB n=1 Tax=Streptomyces lonegramiae TaxID=3075524 RepID=A0ABU2XDP1_9ACTN|nr:RNA-guided endonuclease IscB [Streptomyces sp. DSM 41529]MDT0544024.1 RNA-guided endonuclease IscB [Streptomyces sp. DSM 41529]